ncbi:MAG: NAD(+) synthase [Bacteroidales bacterium]|nr:NAD(+) synthase [Bacteroidales bacterium]
MKNLKDECVAWIRDWFAQNGPSCNAVIGMSGGKDSTITAALCARALGPGRVVGVAMPAEGQSLNEADEICAYLGISCLCLPIGAIEKECDALGALLPGGEFSLQSLQNIPPRIRMTMLYAVAQSMGGMVANTCNLSEDYIGYATLFGDAAGSFSPLGRLVVREVLAIGDDLGLPRKWVHKTPDDGLPGSCPDEEKFGFSYATLDRYIREGVCDDPEVKEKIDRMHRRNLFKTEILHIPSFIPDNL